MTATEWDASHDPRPMLRALVEPPARKLWLFARARVTTSPRGRSARPRSKTPAARAKEVLLHCCAGCAHARGCWVCDAVLL